MIPDKPLCLIVDSNEDHGASLEHFCTAHGYRVQRVGVDALDGVERAQLEASDVAFIDSELGIDAMTHLAEHVLVDAELFAMAESDDTVFAESCIRAGFSFFFPKPFQESGLTPLLDDIADEWAAQHSPERDDADDEQLIQFGLMRGSSRGMRKLFRTLRKIGPSDASVLIVGESGTGKELVAETLHQLSDRTEGPYLTVNCSAIAANLIESELFGHEKGSFSGAQKQHRGFFERAAGGTLFLDEVTEMSADLQAKLLRVLESGEVRRVGASEPMSVDVRIVAATNRDPHEAVAEGVLREDLYYRLAHVTVNVPPLRRRGRDIVGLAQYFLRQLNERHETALTLADDALSKIEDFHWPGNVRQLRHAVDRAYILSEEHISADAFVFDEQQSDVATGDIPIDFGMTLAEAERRIILANLEHLNGDKKEAASRLGISLKTLYNRLNEYEESAAAK